MKMNNKKITVLIVNYNSSDFVELNLYALKFLTKSSFEVFIADNGSKKKDYKNLKKIVKLYDNVYLERINTELRGSLAHGTALNHLTKKIKTPYFSILDADATWLKKDWDEILINKMTDNVPVVGTQSPEPKPQDFPLMFAILFRTKEFKELNIDFRPRDILEKQDTGWELRERYLARGLKGRNLKYLNTRSYKEGPLSKVICAEYYLEGEKNVFASHFGRGSTLGAGKYKKVGGGLLSKIPGIKSIIAKKIAEKEKESWINTCEKIVDQEATREIKAETVSCDFCGSNDYEKLFDAGVLYSNLPGSFSVVKCRECNLVFTNPRPTRDSMSFFYLEGVGYLKNYKPKKRKDFSFKVYRLVLREYFGYFYKERKSIFLKISLFPIFFLKYTFLKTEGITKFVENGKLLDIGCSSGAFLLEMRELGWKAKGIEPSEKVAEHAKKKFNLDVECCGIDSYQTDEKFDVITMKMVLEHVYSPTRVLKKVRSMLKNDGILVVMIPDFSGIESWIYGKHAYTLQVPNHLFHFTPKTINKYLRKAGFKGGIKIYHHSFDRDIVAPLSYLKNKKTINVIRAMVRNKVIRFLLVKPFVKVSSWLGKTSRMTIYVGR